MALRDFCRRTGVPVITTFMGKGVVRADDDLFLFTAGLRALDYTDGTMGRADLMICVGYDVVEWAPSAWNPDGDLDILCIDTVAADVDSSYLPQVELIGHIGHILRDLGSKLWNRPQSSLDVPPYRAAFASALRTESDDGSPVKPQRVLRELRSALAPDDILISDVGVHKMWIARFWEATEPNTVLISNGFAAMGFGLPAAIAASLVYHGTRKIVAVVGDAGFMMSMAELETAKRLGLPLVVMVWNDSALGLIELHQMRRFGRTMGTTFQTPDLVALARSFGIDGLRVESGSEFAPALRKGLDADAPFIIDVSIDYSENHKLGLDLWELTESAQSWQWNGDDRDAR